MKTPEAIAWLAGIYEGEGSCAITKGRAIRVEIVMTDEDIISRVQELTGFGSVRSVAGRAENRKQAYRWSIGSNEAVMFLTSIMPWLGERRKQRAQDAIANWNNNKRQSSSSDTECVNGHSYEALGNKRTKYGTCHLCNLESSKRYRDKSRTKVQPA